MNKQQLASKIWQSANKMRSKIEANDYKDYILGFVFYKFLSEKEEKFLKDNDFSDEDIKQNLNEENTEVVEFVQNSLGYFISYDHLFSTWLGKGKDFDVSDVRDALSAFDRLISSSHTKVYQKIFDTLRTGLSKLGDSSNTQTKAVSDLIHLIKSIPMSGRQDYDVLGFIYEYLISMFAANAGKKAGEFYTPHEVSVLMSDIIAHHLINRQTIKIYDPTSGSGSLLINIGNSIAKHLKDKDSIKYYAQELKENTYNLTRMNLVMRDINPSNILTRNADTLEDDWPYFDDSDPVGTYEPLYVDAVVSNPPYSQAWDTAGKTSDPRYAGFGLAPKTKADFAFLLHDLYHLRPDGIMAIVLPHGVLFRGGEEEKIRTNLIEKNHIDTIIGLPSNIFFGTGIPTIIMLLRQKRENNDVLIIDASKQFIKAGKQNKLQAGHIKKIVDTVIERKSIDKFSKVVSQEEIRKQGYNLNIPRYVDSSNANEVWDIYATMHGGIPKSEIALLNAYWQAFPSLKSQLFRDDNTPYCQLATDNITQTIIQNSEVENFTGAIQQAFANFDKTLADSLIQQMETLNIAQTEKSLSNDIFDRLDNKPLINPYTAYQHFADQWQTISADLEMIQTEGKQAIKQVDPNMVIKKKDGKEVEVQEGYVGHILPFDLVQRLLLPEDLAKLKKQDNRLAQIDAELESLLDNFSEEEKSATYVNDENTAFVTKEVNATLSKFYSDVETEETEVLEEYLTLLANKAKKPAKLAFISSHPEVNWQTIQPNTDGTYGKGKVDAYLKQLRSGVTFDVESLEGKLAQASLLLDEQSAVKKTIKEQSNALHLKTKSTIENLSDEQAIDLLHEKWITPLVEAMYQQPQAVIKSLIAEVEYLAEKYVQTLTEISADLTTAEHELANMLGQLVGEDYDMKGIQSLQQLLGEQ